MTTLKQFAEDVEKVWSPPGGRAWSLADVKIAKLLKTIRERRWVERDALIEEIAVEIEVALEGHPDVDVPHIVRSLKEVE